MIKHTPYADKAGPFEIGLTPLELSNWIEVDAQLPQYLAEKKRLMAEIPSAVFAADYKSETAQEEVLTLLVDYLLDEFPDVYSKDGSIISVLDTDHQVDLDDLSIPPLLNAAMLVQEDLVIMRKEGNAWHLVAGSVCFPSSWVLREKIGRPMHAVHAPVPGYNEGARNAVMIERIFDNLQVELPVERFNWSIYNSDALYQGHESANHKLHGFHEDDDYYIRVEHQTLRKLPKTGDILFTIRIHIDLMNMMAKRSDKTELAQKFEEAIHSMSHEQIVYKGLEGSVEMLISQLKEIAA